MKIDVISASAGSGKTFRLTEELIAALLSGEARPEGVVAITYTVKAAGELESRIREGLLARGQAALAARIRDGYIGTIHSICQRLLREFSLEAGLSPYLEPIPESERRRLFDVAVAAGLRGREAELNELARRLELGDWTAPLLEIVDAARSNGMDATALARSAKESRAGLQQLFGAPILDRATYLARLIAAHGKLQPKLDELATGTVKANRERAARGRKLGASLQRGELPSWKEQVQFAGDLGTRALAPWAGELIALVEEHLHCSAFQEDVLGMQQALFELAGKALTGFVAQKAAARVVDFGDMLAHANLLLAEPAVQESLRARLELVLVDEFQDTSPLQLAVVAALGRLAKRSIWVGDRKQAIFGFQGSDPELMSVATEAALGQAKPVILSRSWRSRPPLVELTSRLFTAALAPHGFPAEQVELTAANPDPAQLASQPVLEAWSWVPDKVERDGLELKASEADALAAGIEELLAAPVLVRERDEAGRCREAHRRDVAILARSNGRCREIAAALRARGIPAKVSLAGLTDTPEAVLARAALALLADPTDGVAALEVGWLGGAASADPEAWLSRRFLQVEAWSKQAEAARARGERPEHTPLPFQDDPRIAALRAAAKEASRLSPAEALDLALRTAGIPAHVRSWPEPGQRLGNLEALRGEALAYEQLCAAQLGAGTVLGLTAHLARLGAEDDEGKQAAPSSEDAVTVLTFHKAKGLEWPVVVLSQLEFDRQRGVFEVAVEPADVFDFAQPLAGRWIRCWPWPYGGLKSNLALLDLANETPEAARTTERDRKERLRLLYVGFTRPRDLLVLVARVTEKHGPATAALELLADGTGAELLGMPFEGAPGLAAAAIAGQQWPCTMRALSGLPVPAEAAEREESRWYAPAPRLVVPAERLSPSGEPLPGTPRLLGVTRLSGRQPLSASSELMASVGDALHAFLAADQAGAEAARTAMATRLLSAHGVALALSPESLLAASDALRACLTARYPGATWFREWPVRARLEGEPQRLLVGEVDLFLELPDGFVLVDHKSFPGGEQERDRKLVAEYGPQLGWYARTLAKALGKPLKGAFIHFPIRGELAELSLPG